MKNTINKLIIAGLLMGLAVFQGQSVSAQEETVNQTITVAGKLVAVDAENSTITVEKAAVEAEAAEAVVLFVEPTTIITKAGEPIVLGSLVVEEAVTVEGMVNEAGGITASSIVVE